MINGAHCILYTTDPERDRAFFRDVLGLSHVDAGGGWLIFALPPAELALHPSDDGPVDEVYLTCDDIDDVVARMKKTGVVCSRTQRQAWGVMVTLTLPSGRPLRVYQPTHARPA